MAEQLSPWDQLVANAGTAYDNLQAQIIKDTSNGITGPIKQAVTNLTSSINGLSQTQTDVSNISTFTDNLKKYIWLVPIVIILLMLAAKSIFKRKGGR